MGSTGNRRKEERSQQRGCYRAGDKTRKLKLENRNVTEDQLDPRLMWPVGVQQKVLLGFGG